MQLFVPIVVMKIHSTEEHAKNVISHCWYLCHLKNWLRKMMLKMKCLNISTLWFHSWEN